MYPTRPRPELADLVYRVYSAPLHEEFFSFGARFLVRQGEWQAEIGLCGDGHVITFRHGGQTACEVIAAASRELPTRHLQVDKRVKGNRTERWDQAGGILYQCCWQVEKLQPDLYRRLQEELDIDSARVRVACRFASGNRLDPAPVSLMRLEEQSHSLLVHTYHTFPKDYAVVKSQSLFEV